MSAEIKNLKKEIAKFPTINDELQQAKEHFEKSQRYFAAKQQQ